MSKKSDSVIYICHTYYHVYMSVVKELALAHTAKHSADICLSTMSNDFEALPDRLRASGIFENVYIYDEQLGNDSEELTALHKDRGNLIGNMLQRIRYTRLLGQLQEEYIPTDLSAYGDVYVFCDSDPIGYYLNYKKIPYHAVEDGLNSGLLDDQAYLANAGAFGIKKFLAKLGLIFIECGYSRYCIDYEVNDIGANHSVPPNVIEVPHSTLFEALDDSDGEMLGRIFIADWDELKNMLKSGKDERPIAMILTEPLCEPDVRRRMFEDIVNDYADTHRVIIKPHPRDLLDYTDGFGDSYVIRGRFPMEVLNNIPDFNIDLLISVITQVDDIRFARKIVYLGLDFLDKYEAPEVHRRLDTLQK